MTSIFAWTGALTSALVVCACPILPIACSSSSSKETAPDASLGGDGGSPVEDGGSPAQDGGSPVDAGGSDVLADGTSSATNDGGAVHPVPTLTSLTPPSVSAGTGAFTLTIAGSGFVPGAQAFFGGTALDTVYQSGTVLQAQVPAALTASPTVAQVSVVNPPPGGGASGSLDFAVGGTIAYDCRDAGAMSTSSDLTFPISAVPDSGAPLMQVDAEVGFDGQNFLLAWSQNDLNGVGSTYGSRVTPMGVALDSPPRQLVANGNVTSLAFNGTNYLAAWSSAGAANRARYVLASRITPDGTNLDPNGIVISAPSSSSSNRGTVACGSATCLLVWADITNNDVNAARVDATAGTVLDASPIRLSTAISGSSFVVPIGVDFDGSNYFVTLAQSTGGSNGDFPWVKVSPAGAILSRGTIALPTSWSGETGALALGGALHLFIWGTLVSAPWQYNALLLNLDGGLIDPNGLLLTTQAGQWKGVAFDGCRFLAMWTTAAGTAIDGTRISPNGSVDPVPSLQIPGEDAGAIQYPQLGSSAQGRSLLAFSQCDSSLLNCLVHARVVTSD